MLADGKSQGLKPDRRAPKALALAALPLTVVVITVNLAVSIIPVAACLGD